MKTHSQLYALFVFTDGYRPCESCDFTRSNCLIYIKSGNIVRKSGKIGKTFNKIGKSIEPTN